jgi:arginase
MLERGPGISFVAAFLQCHDTGALRIRRGATDAGANRSLVGRFPDLTVIWIDSHFDANTPKTSPSGNFHGMPVASIMGEAPIGMRDRLLHQLAPDRFRYVWANVADLGDRAFQGEKGLAWLGDNERVTGPIHSHFDLDVLNPAEFPHLAYPEENGMLVIDAISLLRRLTLDANIVGLTFTEFAPVSDANAQHGVKIISELYEGVRK